MLIYQYSNVDGLIVTALLMTYVNIDKVNLFALKYVAQELLQSHAVLHFSIKVLCKLFKLDVRNIHLAD